MPVRFLAVDVVDAAWWQLLLVDIVGMAFGATFSFRRSLCELVVLHFNATSKSGHPMLQLCLWLMR